MKSVPTVKSKKSTFDSGESRTRTAVVAAEPEKTTSGIRTFLESMFSIDVRSLALFRILIGILIISDLIYRAHDMQAHYTEVGVMPHALLSFYYLAIHPYFYSFHTMNDTLVTQVFLFTLAGLFALSLILGYRTRAVTIISWIFINSLQTRNPMVLSGADDFLRMLLFWSMFVPLGACWSLDRALSDKNTPVPERIFTMGSAGLLLQICYVYWFTALLKTHPMWHGDNTAVYYALTIEQFTKPLGQLLIPHRNLLKVLTFATLRLELFGPFFALFPAFKGALRTFMVFAFIGFHMSLGLCMEIGLFPYICAAAWTTFLPGWFWAKLLPLSKRLPRREFKLLGHPTVRGFSRRLRPQPIPFTMHWSGQIFAGFLIVYLFLWNLRTTDFEKYQKIFPPSVNVVGELLHIDQWWSMFSPFPLRDHGWLVAVGQLKDGTIVDVVNETSPVSWEKPAQVSITYVNDRWRKYLMNLCLDQNSAHRMFYCRYLTYKWNAHYSGDRQLARIDLYFMRQQALPNYQLSPREKVLLYSFDSTSKVAQ